MSKRPEDTIPANQVGTAVDVQDEVECGSEAEARNVFGQVKSRLVNVNGWHAYAGSFSAHFQLTDNSGNGVERLPAKGDFFKISIPAPGIESGEGFDWVQIEEIQESADEQCEFFAIRVRPSSSPVNPNPDTAHFYTNEATSNFIVKREGLKVTAGVYGRNEKPNVKEADTLIDKLRNAVVGTTGVAGFSKLQWNALVKGLLGQ